MRLGTLWGANKQARSGSLPLGSRRVADVVNLDLLEPDAPWNRFGDVSDEEGDVEGSVRSYAHPAVSLLQRAASWAPKDFKWVFLIILLITPWAIVALIVGAVCGLGHCTKSRSSSREATGPMPVLGPPRSPTPSPGAVPPEPVPSSVTATEPPLPDIPAAMPPVVRRPQSPRPPPRQKRQPPLPPSAPQQPLTPQASDLAPPSFLSPSSPSLPIPSLEPSSPGDSLSQFPPELLEPPTRPMAPLAPSFSRPWRPSSGHEEDPPAIPFWPFIPGIDRHSAPPVVKAPGPPAAAAATSSPPFEIDLQGSPVIPGSTISWPDELNVPSEAPSYPPIAPALVPPFLGPLYPSWAPAYPAAPPVYPAAPSVPPPPPPPPPPPYFPSFLLDSPSSDPPGAAAAAPPPSPSPPPANPHVVHFIRVPSPPAYHWLPPSQPQEPSLRSFAPSAMPASGGYSLPPLYAPPTLPLLSSSLFPAETPAEATAASPPPFQIDSSLPPSAMARSLQTASHSQPDPPQPSLPHGGPPLPPPRQLPQLPPYIPQAPWPPFIPEQPVEAQAVVSRRLYQRTDDLASRRPYVPPMPWNGHHQSPHAPVSHSTTPHAVRRKLGKSIGGAYIKGGQSGGRPSRE